MTSASPEWIWGIAIIIFAIALAYWMARSRRRSRAEKKVTDAATRDLYRDENS
jgi:Flp pilus assembly protein TadB